MTSCGALRGGRLGGLVAGLCGLLVARGGAQTLPSSPIALADGHVTVGGDVSASFGSDDPRFYNYTDYEHSLLRMLRVDLSAAVKAGGHLSLLADLQTENLDGVHPYALYVRIRPWTTRALDIQVGRIPPTFGAFARRTYVSDNLLIGYPLGYQYLTSIRPDSLPANADELLQKRTLGWHVRYSVGDQTPATGVPLVSAFRWDTGVQVHASTDLVSVTAAVTAGTVSNPLFTDDNSGKQLVGRVEVHPSPGLAIGTSLARGPFVSDSAARIATGATSSAGFTQTAWGGDVEYSRDYFLVRAETIVSVWRLPIADQPAMPLPLRATSTSIEGRYKIRPGLYAAARLDHLGFSEIAGTQVTEPWDSPVTRFEVGGGYSLQRNLLLKLSYLHSARDGGRLAQPADQAATQVVFWF
jgi:hypothetical protein